MMTDLLGIALNFFSSYLIEVMGVLLVLGLIFRAASYKLSKREDAYFSSFISEVEKALSASTNDKEEVEDVDQFLDTILKQVSDKLPTRSVRYGNFSRKKEEKDKDKINKSAAKSIARHRKTVSLRDFVHGEKSLFHSIKGESSIFKSKYPPNFDDLTDRILEKDTNWNKLLNLFTVAPISRLNDILPGLFVVFGIFGTFIGISMALPKIAAIDFSNIEASGTILQEFVLNIAFAMKTSIAGILFSLITTVLNTMAPVGGLREKTFKKLSTSFEEIWNAIHGSKSIEASLQESLPGLLNEVKRINSYIEDQNKAS